MAGKRGHHHMGSPKGKQKTGGRDFGPGNQASAGKGTKGSAHPKTGRPKADVVLAVRELMISRGLRTEALTVIELALAERYRGRVTANSLRAAEYVLAKTDPPEDKKGLLGGLGLVPNANGEITLNVRRIPWERPNQSALIPPYQTPPVMNGNGHQGNGATQSLPPTSAFTPSTPLHTPGSNGYSNGHHAT